MHKLIILIETPEDTLQFDESWPLFLQQAEKMPGLIREAAVRVTQSIFGDYNVYMIHELFFESYMALQEAMSSLQGQKTGRILQMITNGHMALLFAEHREDELENIKKYQLEGRDVDTC